MHTTIEVAKALGRSQPKDAASQILAKFQTLLKAQPRVSIHPGLDPHYDPDTGWAAPAVSLHRWSIVSTGTAGQRVSFALHLPHVQRDTPHLTTGAFAQHVAPDGGYLAWHIDALHVTWRGGSGHGALPSGKPKVHLYDPSGELVKTLTDDAADVTAYELTHSTLALVSPEVATEPGAYTLEIECESLTNAADGLQVFHAGAQCRLGLVLP